MNSLIEHLRTKSDNLDSRTDNLRTPIPGADTHPNSSRHTISQFMKGECGIEADHTIRHELRRFCERMICIQRGIGKLIESTAQLVDEALPLHARNGRGADTLFDEFGQARHATLVKERSCAIFLTIWGRSHLEKYDTKPCQCQYFCKVLLHVLAMNH